MKTTTVKPSAYSQNTVNAPIINPATTEAPETMTVASPEVQTPAVEPATAAPELTRAELIAHRTTQLNRLNTVARQVTKLQEMYSELGKFHFEVTSDEERHFSTIVLTDDNRKDFRISNAALCQMLADFLKEKLGEKLTEKQAELLAIEL